MSIIALILGWLFSLLFGLLALSMALTGNWFRFILLAIAVLLLLPPIQTLIQKQFGLSIPGWARVLGAVLCLVIFGWSMATEKPTSIYFTPEAEAEHMQIYDSKLAQWPTTYETRFVDSSYGKVHVIISGPEQAPPVLLLNAGQMAGWSWLLNVGALNQQYRTYAIDTIGEPGKSVLNDLRRYPKNGKELSDLYAEITDALGIEKVFIVGASNGGFIAANYAIYYPERVEKMALLGPMGLTPSTNENIVRITLAQLYPLKPIQDNTIQWAFGDDPRLIDQIDDWFRLVLTGTAPKQPPPTTMTAEQLQKVGAPVLLVLGNQDRLMGDLDNVEKLASNVPEIEIVKIDAGHLMGLEAPERVNELVIEFLGQ